jgi:hypothetical protein
MSQHWMQLLFHPGSVKFQMLHPFHQMFRLRITKKKALDRHDLMRSSTTDYQSILTVCKIEVRLDLTLFSTDFCLLLNLMEVNSSL